MSKEGKPGLVSAIPAGTASFEESVRLTGEVHVSDARTVHVSSPLSGVVLNSPAQAGQRVAAGDVLFEIDSHDVAEAKTDLLKKAAALDLATKTAEREALLFEKKISAEMEVQEARSRQAEARIELEGATSRLTRLGVAPQEHPVSGAGAGDALSGRVAVRASRAGTVLEGHANPGEYVEAGKELFVVSDLSEVWVWADLKDADLAAVSAAGKAAAAMIEGPAGIVARGSVDIVSGTVSEQTRTARARIVVANPSGALRPGMFVTVRIAGPARRRRGRRPEGRGPRRRGPHLRLRPPRGGLLGAPPGDARPAPRRQGRDRRRPRAGPADHRRRLLPAQIRRPALEDGRRLRRLGERAPCTPSSPFSCGSAGSSSPPPCCCASPAGSAWTRLPIDAFPDVTNVQVMVLTEAAGLSAADVEQQVTYPIEQQMGGVPRVTQVRSLSKAGLSQVIVVFEDDTDIYFARQLVFERLQGAQGAAPGRRRSRSWGRSAPGWARSSSTRSRARRSRRWSCARSRTGSWRRSCAPIPGVNEVNSFGGFVKQYHVLVRPDALLKYDLGLRDIVEALERNNANAAGGFIVRGWEQTYVRGLGQIAGIEDIREVVLKVADGTPVHVHDVADVVVGAADPPGRGLPRRQGRGGRRHGDHAAGRELQGRGDPRQGDGAPDPEEPAAGGRASTSSTTAPR